MYTILVCTTFVCVCTPEGPCSITICCISVYTIAAAHRSVVSLLYAMGLISHYCQQGWNRKKEMMKNEELIIMKMVCF